MKLFIFKRMNKYFLAFMDVIEIYSSIVHFYYIYYFIILYYYIVFRRA